MLYCTQMTVAAQLRAALWRILGGLIEAAMSISTAYLEACDACRSLQIPFTKYMSACTDVKCTRYICSNLKRFLGELNDDGNDSD